MRLPIGRVDHLGGSVDQAVRRQLGLGLGLGFGWVPPLLMIKSPTVVVTIRGPKHILITDNTVFFWHHLERLPIRGFAHDRTIAFRPLACVEGS